MKYATVMTTGLLVNISIFASNMTATEPYADLMENKQRMIRQLNKQAECVRLASDERQLKVCEGLIRQGNLHAANVEKAARNAHKSKNDNLNETEFF